MPIARALPDSEGNFLFRPQFGGGPLEKRGPRRAADPGKYVEASHFGEINAYHHLTLIAERINRLLSRLGEKPLPRVRAFVNAHGLAGDRVHWRWAVTDEEGAKWRPLRGADYRFPNAERAWHTAGEEADFSGAVLLGPGLRSGKNGWLPQLAGRAYARNAAHDAGEIYRCFGFHISRHCADFRANALQSLGAQSNSKSNLESALSRYWAASQLGTPHITCWVHRYDADFVDPGSLAKEPAGSDLKELSDGERLAAALWNLREELRPCGEELCDLLVLAALLEIGRLTNHPYKARVKETRALRSQDGIFVAALRHANAARFGGAYAKPIVEVMERWGLRTDRETRKLFRKRRIALPAVMAGSAEVREHVELVRSWDPETIIPADHEMLATDDLERRLRVLRHEPYHLVAAGDVMTGGRMRRYLRDIGPDYPFAWVKPLFNRASIVMTNLEAPFARDAERDVTTRNFSYRVDPGSAPTLRRAGINVMNLANNHLMDCGPEGVTETLATLGRQGIAAIGGGQDEARAHDPAIVPVGPLKVGLLGYYWNRRTAARANRPGSARDLPELAQRDIEALKQQADRIVVTVHWGVPYEREPAEEDRQKARHFIDCGADIVIGHHPHIIQPLEVHRQRPIFYSVGNFAFGSGNSRAESIVLGVGFEEEAMEVDIFPAYVRNRDPRLAYQPKLMCGEAARLTLERLVSISGPDGGRLEIGDFHARLRLKAAEEARAPGKPAPVALTA